MILKMGNTFKLFSKDAVEALREDENRNKRLEREAFFNSKININPKPRLNIGIYEDEKILSHLMKKTFDSKQKDVLHEVEKSKKPFLIYVKDNDLNEKFKQNSRIKNPSESEYFKNNSAYCTGCKRLYSLNDLSSQYIETHLLESCKCGAHQMKQVTVKDTEAFIKKVELALEKRVTLTDEVKPAKQHKAYVDILEEWKNYTFINVTKQSNVGESFEIELIDNDGKISLPSTKNALKTGEYCAISKDDEITYLDSESDIESFKFFIEKADNGKNEFINGILVFKYSDDRYYLNRFLKAEEGDNELTNPFYNVTVDSYIHDLKTENEAIILLAALGDNRITQMKIDMVKESFEENVGLTFLEDINERHQIASFQRKEYRSFINEMKTILVDDFRNKEDRVVADFKWLISPDGTVGLRPYMIRERLEGLKNEKYYFAINQKQIDRIRVYNARLAFKIESTHNAKGQKVYPINSRAIASLLDFIELKGENGHTYQLTCLSKHMIKLKMKFGNQLEVESLEDIICYNYCAENLLSDAVSLLPEFTVIRECYLQDVSIRLYIDGIKMMKQCEQLSSDGIKGRVFDIKNIKDEHNVYQDTLKCLIDENKETQRAFSKRYENWENQFIKINDEKLIILAPSEYNDLLVESNNLNHCLFSYNDTIADGLEMVLFVREDIDTSLYTISLDKNGMIVQSSGYEHAKVNQEVLNELQSKIYENQKILNACKHFYIN